MGELAFKVRLWFEDRLPDPRQRRTALILAPVMALCLAWIVFFVVSSAMAGPARVRQTPQVKHAAEITGKLHQEPDFAGVTVLQHVDYPGKFRVSGAVKSKAEIELLKVRLSEMDPKGEFVVEVRAGD